MKKPIHRLYPKKIVTLGDHIRAKRLDLKLRQVDLVKPLQVCQTTIKNWEKNHTQPHLHHIPLICDFLTYCPLNENKTEHFGHQLRNYRLFTLGISIFDLATQIGIDEATLSEIEQTNIIRYTSVLNSINRYLEEINWQFTCNTQPIFFPKRIKCKRSPKYHAPICYPKTLGEHIALKRKQLKLT